MIIGVSYPNKNRTTIGALGYLVGRGARFIFEHKLEFAVGAVLLVAYTASTALPLWLVLAAWSVLVAGVAYDLRNERRVIGLLAGHWTGSRTGRDLASAAHDSGVELSVQGVQKTLPGELVDVRLARGQTISRLEKQDVRDAIAGCLGEVSDVRVIRNRQDKSRAQLAIIRRDTFATMSGIPWPLLGADKVDVDAGFPFAQDEYGRIFDVRLLSRNLLLGGAPDAGKSAALRVLVAACALDPKYKLWMLDGKTEGAEFVHWAPAAQRLVRGRNLEAAAELFIDLDKRVEERGRDIVAAGEVFVLPEMERDVLFADEVHQFLRVFETDTEKMRKCVKAIRMGIWKMIAVGRWAGMISILSAQKPTADIIPTESRDLIDHRFALHCNKQEMLVAIVGDNPGEEISISAADIPSGQPGVGYYVDDNGTQKVRSFFISHQQAREIASRVAGDQLDAELQAMT